MSKLKSWANHKPTVMDAIFLILATIVVTLHPFYLYGKINLFEAGLYLPGIDAIFKGAIPYRDFFHLRGPLELYFQVLWVKIAGENYFALPTYFYVGAVTTLGIYILIAKELLNKRFFLYAMSLTLVARTFPRVSFDIGGGFRQVWGAAVVYLIIRFLKKKDRSFLWLAGFFSAVALMTSVEIGVYCFASVFLALLLDSWFSNRKLFAWNLISVYVAGALLVLVPLVIFLQLHQALVPMLDAYHQVCSNMMRTFPQADPVPRNVLEVVSAMFNPVHTNFKHMTPLFCYFGGIIYLFSLHRKGRYYPGTIGLAVYGLLSFIGSMRGLWGPGFENAIQPEKVLLFVLLELAWVSLKDSKKQCLRITAVVLFLVVFLSTVMYALPRFQRRFNFVKIMLSSNSKKLATVFPFSERDLVVLDFPRMKGMVVPQKQAQDMQGLYRFFYIHSKLKDQVVFFPDIGVYNFIINRPFVGRFPIVTLSWIGKGWHKEFMQDMEKEKPSYVVLYKELPWHFPKTQLVVPENNRKYEDVLAYVSRHYRVVSSTPSFNIWQRYDREGS